ncbi:MAG: hypothetical protein JXQ71_11085, partial [Verrucomicrobia bacterium]|nr:hypothetical protein [Verrucomicrobiota bacterium]
PTVVALTPTSPTNLVVSFSEPVEAGTATDTMNYLLAGGDLSVYAAVLEANLTDVVLTTDPMSPGVEYTLGLSGIADRAVPVPNQMDAVILTFTAYNPPPRTAPLIEVRFEEGAGGSVTNSGTVGGTGTIDIGVAASAAGLPGFTNNVPVGPYAPAANQYSLYTGTGSGHIQYAGKAVDFPDPVRTNTVGLEQFTVSGWINLTDGTIGSGGNRILSTWPQNVDGLSANRLTGVDVVVATNGTLRLGVNQAPDYPSPPGNIGPTSSTGRAAISASADPANWVFFAVTYDASLPTESTKFYFGNGQTPAVLDVVSNYNRGAVADCTAPVTLTLANFMDSPPLTTTRDSTSNSRAFRGLMDEIRLFRHALTLEEIRQIQVRAAGLPDEPTLLIARDGARAVITWTSTATFQLVYKDSLDAGDWTPVTEPTVTAGNQHTVEVNADQPMRFYQLRY